jgi:hypothetical protein
MSSDEVVALARLRRSSADVLQVKELRNWGLDGEVIQDLPALLSND